MTEDTRLPPSGLEIATLCRYGFQYIPEMTMFALKYAGEDKEAIIAWQDSDGTVTWVRYWCPDYDPGDKWEYSSFRELTDALDIDRLASGNTMYPGEPNPIPTKNGGIMNYEL